MNWIYIDRSSYEVKYGVRVEAQPHITGPFDATRQDHRLLFDGWEGFVVVEEGNEKGELEVVLSRAEKRTGKAKS
jgi:hypothetical protein